MTGGVYDVLTRRWITYPQEKTVPKFMTKPILVEARQFNPNAPLIEQEKLATWCGGALLGVELYPMRRAIGLLVDSEWTEAAPGDWIVRYPNGQFVTVSEKKFVTHYDPVADGQDTDTDQKVA